jgi:FAD binding domain/Berberine and berberine like
MSIVPRIKTRREFIKQSAVTIAMLPFLFSCGQSSKSSSYVLNKDALNKLRKNFGGQIIVPNDAQYELKRQAGFLNPNVDRHPSIIAICKDEQDVIKSLEFAQQLQLEIAVRSGNHSNMGWGTVENGKVIDLSQMKSVTINPAKKTAIVSAGATAAEILAATAVYGLAPVLGECGSVGSGLALGGGLGWLAGKYGATCDNLLHARVIKADLQAVHADTKVNDDLFWAIRGGGGNFGIATSFEYQLHPVNEILGGSFVYPINKARFIIKYFNEFMSNAPDELQADCYLTSKECWVEFVYFGNLDKGEFLLNQFRKFAKPERDSLKRRLFSEVYNMEPGGDLSTDLYLSNKGSYIKSMSDEVIDFVMECVSQPPQSCKVFFDFSHYMHGEVCRVASDATAFELRQPNAVHLGHWLTWKEPMNAAACITWHNKIFERLESFASGRVYANYMSTSGGANAKSVFGSNFMHLKQIKKKYDPNNIFHLNQNILPK